VWGVYWGRRPYRGEDAAEKLRGTVLDQFRFEAGVGMERAKIQRDVKRSVAIVLVYLGILGLLK